jgi:hypothetical protein
MLHTISGNNYHGEYVVRVRAPSQGGILSRKVARKVARAICGMTDCQCGGGYGTGPTVGTARLDYSQNNNGDDVVALVPA